MLGLDCRKAAKASSPRVTNALVYYVISFRETALVLRMIETHLLLGVNVIFFASRTTCIANSAFLCFFLKDSKGDILLKAMSGHD